MDRQLLNSIVEFREALEGLNNALDNILHGQGIAL